jgi:hypothetical protein
MLNTLPAARKCIIPAAGWSAYGEGEEMALEFTRVKLYIVSSSNRYGTYYAPGVHE